MNKRIQQLAEQAGATYYKRYFDPTPATVLANSDALEKFAHLIIEDCKKAFWSEDCFVSDLAIDDYNKQVEKIRKRYED